MTTLTTDYLIIGNSAAGITAAEHIRAHDERSSILIVSDEPYAAYGRPLISYLIEGKTAEARMGFKDTNFYENHAIDTLFGSDYKAMRLDADAYLVTLANGDEVSYGKCLVATGSVPFTPPIEGLDGKPNVFTFMTLDQAQAVWDATRAASKAAHVEGRSSRAIVIGGGLIGLKAAEALSHHIDDVTVLELAPRILPAVLDDEGAAVLQEFLANRGISCLPDITVEALRGDPVCEALLTNGDVMACDLVVAAVGVRPNVYLAAEAGAACARGLVCGTDLQTSLPDVYAAGDVTQVTDLLDGSLHPLALWPNAIRQGKTAGLFMANADDAEPFLGNFAVNAVDFFDTSLLTAGVINPPADGGYDETVIAGTSTYAKFVTKDNRLTGYILLNRPANAGLYTALIEQCTPLSSCTSDLFGKVPLNLDLPADIRWERLHKCYPSNLDDRGWKELA